MSTPQQSGRNDVVCETVLGMAATGFTAIYIDVTGDVSNIVRFDHQLRLRVTRQR